MVNPKKFVQNLVNGETIEQQSQQLQTQGVSVMNVDKHLEDLIGEYIFIQTPTYALAGKLTSVSGSSVVIEQAVWIGSVGCLDTAFAKPNFNRKDNDAALLPAPMVVGTQTLIYATRLPSKPTVAS